MMTLDSFLARHGSKVGPFLIFAHGKGYAVADTCGTWKTRTGFRSQGDAESWALGANAFKQGRASSLPDIPRD
jgi:hypothetical protein